MDRESIKNYAIKVITERLEKSNAPEKINFFQRLWDNHLLDQERILKGCINHFYQRQFKLNDCDTKNTIIDAAIEFEVSCSMVKNTIYKFKHVGLDF